MIMEDIASSDDRVVIHQALKHLVVAGNALIFMGPNGLKMYPLNRYAVDRDGDGNVIEIVTREKVSKKLVKNFYPDYKPSEMRYQPVEVWEEYPPTVDECDIYTHASVKVRKWSWYQEIEGKAVPNSKSTAPDDTLPLDCIDHEPCRR